MNLLRFFWLGVFAFFIGIASYLAEEIFFPIRHFPQGTLESQIYEDLSRLRDHGKLPSEFTTIHQVFVLDERIQRTSVNWEKLSSLNFPQSKEGKYDLQIELFDTNQNLSDKDSSKVSHQIIQFSLFDKNTKNKIWELSRQYFHPTKTAN